MPDRKKAEGQWDQKSEQEERNEIDLEQSMEALENVINRLEQDSLSLEQAFLLYKKGMDLLLVCNQAIDKVEKELMIIEENGVGNDV